MGFTDITNMCKVTLDANGSLRKCAVCFRASRLRRLNLISTASLQPFAPRQAREVESSSICRFEILLVALRSVAPLTFLCFDGTRIQAQPTRNVFPSVPSFPSSRSLRSFLSFLPFLFVRLSSTRLVLFFCSGPHKKRKLSRTESGRGTRRKETRSLRARACGTTGSLTRPTLAPCWGSVSVPR